MPVKDWPSVWPVKPIPTKPHGPPYFEGTFQLHVEPHEFIIHEFGTTKPFWFRIKNPLENVWIEWFIVIPGALQLVGEGWRSGILKPLEVSEPIGLLDGPDPNWFDSDWDHLNRKISIKYWHVDAKKWKKGKGYRLTEEAVGTFYPNLVLMPSFQQYLQMEERQKSRHYQPILHEFEPWEPVKDKRRCVIL